MDFSTLSSFPLLPGLPREEYLGALSESTETVNDWSDMIQGFLGIDGVERECVVGFESNRATSVSIVQLEQGDSFFGVPLGETSIKIQRHIDEKGIDSILTYEYLALPEQRVALFFVEGEACVIRWFDPSVYSPEKFINSL